MDAFVFEYVAQLTNNWHSGGGLVVFAESEEAVKALLRSKRSIKLTDEDWKECKRFPLGEGVEPQSFVFEDAGCC